MNEKDLNIEYICKKTLLNKDDELVPIILDLIQESYKAGLCQAEFDNTMNLIEETQELKKKYENAVADYENAMFEKEQLKKQLEPDYYVKGLEGTLKEYQQEMKKVAKQQKEFIKWLEDLIKQNETVVEVSKYGLPKNCSKLLIDFYKEILQKYKEIIGDDK